MCLFWACWPSVDRRAFYLLHLTFRYCQKTPQFKACFKNLTETVKPCFTVEEQKNLNTVYNVSEQLAEFVCFKEGDRIARKLVLIC